MCLRCGQAERLPVALAERAPRAPGGLLEHTGCGGEMAQPARRFHVLDL
jgi:hypothetical protein